MGLSLNISYADALRLSRRTGMLVSNLYGRPYLVIGIERGGTAIAGAFAEGANAANSILITSRRPSSRGWRGEARKIIQRITPRSLRKFYRRLFFKSFAHASRLITNDNSLDQSEIDKLVAALTPDSPKFIIVVDDAIDSGGTASLVLETIRELAPHHYASLFTVTTTAGIRVHPDQLNVFADIIEYDEGDIGDLAPKHRDRAQWLDRPVEEQSISETQTQRLLYLDLDGTIVPNSFRSAYAILCQRQFFSGDWKSLSQLVAARIARKLRVINHVRLAHVLDRHIGMLSPTRAEQFQEQLAAELAKRCRWSLVALAKAPNVKCSIVTAALSSYALAIERAFGIPVLTGSGPGMTGDLVEVAASHKVEAIKRDLPFADNGTGSPALLLGDTMTDALATSEGLEVAIVPDWDKTGMLTVLGAESWWAGMTEANLSAADQEN